MSHHLREGTSTSLSIPQHKEGGDSDDDPSVSSKLTASPPLLPPSLLASFGHILLFLCPKCPQDSR